MMNLMRGLQISSLWISMMKWKNCKRIHSVLRCRSDIQCVKCDFWSIDFAMSPNTSKILGSKSINFQSLEFVLPDALRCWKILFRRPRFLISCISFPHKDPLGTTVRRVDTTYRASINEGTVSHTIEVSEIPFESYGGCFDNAFEAFLPLRCWISWIATYGVTCTFLPFDRGRSAFTYSDSKKFGTTLRAPVESPARSTKSRARSSSSDESVKDDSGGSISSIEMLWTKNVDDTACHCLNRPLCTSASSSCSSAIREMAVCCCRAASRGAWGLGEVYYSTRRNTQEIASGG